MPADQPQQSDTQAPNEQSSTVYVIDDEAGIRSLIETVAEGLGYNARSYANAEQFLDDYDPAAPGCLVVDIYLPTMNGLELLERITQRRWRIPMIVMSGKAEVSEAVRAFRAGGMDFLEKPFDPETLEACLRRAIKDDSEYRSGAAERDEIRQRIDTLTPRETQVMGLVVAGKSNKAIAGTLGVSPKTVEVHRANVMQKMKADSLAALVKMAVQEGIRG